MPKGWKVGLKCWKSEDKSILSKLQYCYDRPKFFVEFWRPKITCCHSDSSEMPSAKTSLKNLLGVL